MNAEEILDKIDWIEFHKEMVLYNSNIYIFDDGTMEAHQRSDFIVNDRVVAEMKSTGIGDSASDYSEGWAKQDYTTGEYVVIEDGRRLNTDEMIKASIEERDWDEDINIWKQEIREQIEERYLKQ